MGVSTDAIIAYGVDLSLDDYGYTVDVPWKNHSDIEDWWVQLNGLDESLWGKYSEWLEAEESKGNRGSLDEYQRLHPDFEAAQVELYRKRSDLIDQLPVEVVEHCHYEYPMYILAAKGTKLRASRGYPEAISELRVDPESADRAAAFCEKYGIKWAPKWWLFSYWG